MGISMNKNYDVKLQYWGYKQNVTSITVTENIGWVTEHIEFMENVSVKFAIKRFDEIIENELSLQNERKLRTLILSVQKDEEHKTEPVIIINLDNVIETKQENDKTKYKVGDKLRFKRGNEDYWKNCIEYMHCEIINVEEDCEDELPYQIEFSTPNGKMFYWCKENALFLESEVPNNETK